MGNKAFEENLVKLYDWVGQKLSACPVRDGVTFYYRSEKVFKAMRVRDGWHLQFNVSVPDCPGLSRLTQEEARQKKLGKARWIYKGNSEQEVHQLVQAALESLPQRLLIDPAMSRDTATICEANCSCYKKIERLLSNSTISSETAALLQKAYDFLMVDDYVEFVKIIRQAIEDITSSMLIERGLKPGGTILEKTEALVELKLIPKNMADDVEFLFSERSHEQLYSVQERAYPMALMLIAFLSKLIKLY